MELQARINISYPPSPSPERHNTESNHALYLINPALNPVSIRAWESEYPRIVVDLPAIATPFSRSGLGRA